MVNSFSYSISGDPVLKPGNENQAEKKELDKDLSADNCILLVDDDEITFNIISIWLKKIAAVDYAPNKEMAFKLIRKKQYPLIIMDINLKKGQNGIEILKEIRKMPEYAKIPVIACTAYAMTGDEEKLIAFGFNRYISKPFEKEKIVGVTKELLKINGTKK